MSEIKDKVITELRSAGFSEGQINYVFGMRGFAIVDRDAELPSPGIDLDSRLVTLSGTYGAYRLAQQDMTEKDWIKEVKE